MKRVFGNRAPDVEYRLGWGSLSPYHNVCDEYKVKVFQFPGPRGETVFDSGVEPTGDVVTRQEMLPPESRLLRRWESGNFSAARGFEDLTDQDLLIAEYGRTFAAMDICDNYRGRHRPYHANCSSTPAQHSGYFAAGARGRLVRAKAPCALRPLAAALGGAGEADGGGAGGKRRHVTPR